MVLVTALELESLRVCYCQKDSLGVCVCVFNLERDGKCFFDATCQSVNIYFFENFVSGKIEQLAEAVSKIMLSRN